MWAITRSIRSVLVAAIAAILLASCASARGRVDDVRANMSAFDRLYIPALTMTSGRDVSGQAVVAVKQLRNQWEVFSVQQPSLIASDPGLRGIAAEIERADRLVMVGKHAEANRAIRGIWDAMYSARKRNGIAYYLDYLVEFRDATMPMMRAAGEKKTDRLALDGIRAALPGALQKWQALAEAEFIREEFWFNEQSEATLKEQVSRMGLALTRIRKALDSGTGADLRKGCRELRALYGETFKMFGNYAGASLS